MGLVKVPPGTFKAEVFTPSGEHYTWLVGTLEDFTEVIVVDGIPCDQDCTVGRSMHYVMRREPE